MALEIKIRSARSIDVDGKKVIEEISYQYSDATVGTVKLDTAMRLPIEGIDVNGDGFVDAPNVNDLAAFVQAVNESLPGTEGCANAHLTLIKQLGDMNVAKAAPIVVSEYIVDGVGIEDEGEE